MPHSFKTKILNFGHSAAEGLKKSVATEHISTMEPLIERIPKINY